MASILPPAPPLTPVPAHAVERTVAVCSSDALRAALAAAQPGDELVLAPGEYRGPWIIAGKRGITVSGPHPHPHQDPDPDPRPDATTRASDQAVLHTTHGGKPCVLLQDCSGCTLRGLVLDGGQKGLMVDRSSGCVFDRLDVGRTRMEAVHLRNQSTECTLQRSCVHDTGLGGAHPAGHGRTQADDGEGVYIGTALSNTPRDAQTAQPVPDRSDRARVLHNRIWNTSAECIDVKEFTAGGFILGNTLDGRVARARGAPAMIELKGSGYTVHGNTFTQPTEKHLVKVFAIRGAPGSGQLNTVSL